MISLELLYDFRRETEQRSVCLVRQQTATLFYSLGRSFTEPITAVATDLTITHLAIQSRRFQTFPIVGGLFLLIAEHGPVPMDQRVCRKFVDVACQQMKQKFGDDFDLHAWNCSVHEHQQNGKDN